MQVATSWSDLLEQLYVDSWNPALRRYRSPFAFRGGSSATHNLTTTLHRLAAGRDARRLELALLRNFRKYAHDQTRGHGELSIWHWLAVGQHHGLPTRLLDWTYSPLVALHFATCQPEADGADGVVWCVDFVAANKLLPSRLRRIMEEEQSETLSLEMLGEFDSLRAFDALSRTPFVVFIEPPSLDVRMLNQFALFSLMPGPHLEFSTWLRAHPRLWRRVVIPAHLKWEVRDKLDQANISERTLFPGLDGLARWLERYYQDVKGPPPDAARSITPARAPQRRRQRRSAR